jgi:hypothetical protein
LGEGGVHPLAEPGLLRAPADAFRHQNLIDPAALDGDPLVLGQVRDEAVERPTGKRQPEVGRLGEDGCNEGTDVVGGVRAWCSSAVGIG